jgi:RpiR family carbohydrate utilization transcriptional regulator
MDEVVIDSIHPSDVLVAPEAHKPPPLALAGLLDDVRAKAEQLGPAGRKVAAFFAGNIATLPELTITEIARGAGVSEPTVGRICQALGFAGYREFRIRLARAAGQNLGHIPADISPADRPADVARKVIDQSLVALQRLRDQISPSAVADAAATLAESRRVEFYGHGNSGIVAQDAQHKFFRLGIPAIAYTDSHVHAMSAALLGPRDSVLAISRSGRTAELVRTAEILKERQVPLVTIAPNDTPLARLASINVDLDFGEDPDVCTPMSSRLGQLVVVDILAVAVAVQRGALASLDMTRARQALREKRV